jgi:hypothetical protein
MMLQLSVSDLQYLCLFRGTHCQQLQRADGRGSGRQPPIAQRVLRACTNTPFLCLQTYIRVQVDLFALGGQTMADVALYNEGAQDYIMDMIPTPKWRTSADVMYTSVSVPADARLTDLSGTGSESIAPTSSTHQLGQSWFVFYRRDVFAAAQIAHPESMGDILSAAQQLNGSDFNGDAAADYSVCFNADPDCVDSFFTFLGILGPMLQTAPSQGVLFQPDTMEPLVQNAAMEEAVAHLFQSLQLQ